MLQATTSSSVWWWASALFVATRLDAPDSECLQERVVFLLHAERDSDVTSGAYAIAKSKEHRYKSAEGEPISWCLKQIEDVQELMDTEFKDGTEVYWSYLNLPGEPPNIIEED